MLKESGLIAAEDTRETRKLLKHYNIKTPLISYYERNKVTRIPQILEILKNKDVALVSEAGMPGISDPGYELVGAAIKERIEIFAVPGPSAILAALSVSGLPASSFLFSGFLPRRQSERRSHLESLSRVKQTLVFFEAPHRLKSSLSDILHILGDRKITVAREMTKLHEEIFRGAVSASVGHFKQPRGEFTLVVEGGREEKKEITGDILSEVKKLKGSGYSLKEAVRETSEKYKISSKLLYREYIRLAK